MRSSTRQIPAAILAALVLAALGLLVVSLRISWRPIATVFAQSQGGRSGRTAAGSARKKLLALGDTHTGYTHDSIGHALAVIDKLGRDSGLYDTYIRTDSQWITKQEVPAPARNARNLNYFDAVFLFISGEGDWTDQQKRDFVSFVRDDGKGVVGAHTGNGAFYQWPEFGEMMGGYFDNHPWGVFEGNVVVDAPDFPVMRHFPLRFKATEEFYALRDQPYSREKVRVLAHLDPSGLDLKRSDYHRTDADLPVALARTYGKGRTFWSNFGHAAETWDNPDIQKMYLEAIKWAMGLTPGDAAPRGQSGAQLPAGDGRDVVMTACSPCHGLPTVIEARRTRTSWEDVVDEMVGLGAKLEEESTKKQAVAYLARWFGRANVNLASPKDLQDVGGFTSEEAAALVRYRARHGDFHSLEDLRKVPGLDPAAVDKNRARIAFTGR